MSNFVAFFPASESTLFPEAEFKALERLTQDVFRIQDIRIWQRQGFGFLASTFREADPIRVCGNDDGCALVKGAMLNVQSEDPTVDQTDLLQEFVTTGRLDRDRYEGTFAAVVWDARRRRGLVLNDHAATLNAYYGEFPQGLYVTTHALPLARALRLPLAAESVCDLLARGQILTPDTMFRGLKRLGLGEQLFYEKGRAAVERYWLPYGSTTYTTVPRAAEAIEEVLVDRVRRYARGRQPIVCDLTSGYDSRLVVCGCDRAGVDFALTVNGEDDDEEVVISKMVAEKLGRPWIHFAARDLWTTPVDERMRRELLYRTDGGLVFSAIYHHLLSRPLLARTHQFHFIGGHGDSIRYHPWSHELWNIGKRRLANIRMLVQYRFLQGGLPPQSLFHQQWQPFLRNRLHSRIEEICRLVPDPLNTQQLDAVHLWKMTGHFSAYSSALWDWLPSATPLGTAGFQNAAFAASWQAKRSSRLIRTIMNDLSPDIAHVKTQYGSSGAPPSWKTLHQEAFQFCKQATHLVDKIDRTAFKGIFGSRFRKKERHPPVRVPYLTPEFRAEMTLDRFRSRRLYREDALAALLHGSNDVWYANEPLLLKIATVELLCRELDFEPDKDFLPNSV